MIERRVRWFGLLAAIVLLDAAVTFENLWPAPAVTWQGKLSIELALAILVLAIVSGWTMLHARRTARWLTVAWVVLVVGRYAEVTAPALYGRDVNLYWDLRFIPDVVSMVTKVAPPWLVALALAGVALIFLLLYVLLRSAWRRVVSATADPRERRVALAAAAAVFALFLAERAIGSVPGLPSFAAPVTRTYARQARFVIGAMSGSTALAASPAMDSDLAQVKGADVFVVFVESYGAISYDRPDIAQPLATARTQLATAVRETGQDVVSAFVESPTFGGSSWLAHLSLMSGIEVRDPDTNAQLMTAHRDTLVRAFSRRGFRTIALMPGLRQHWPEGSFYGFDGIYGADRLAYRGPEFGWFAIPDQFSLARLDALEVDRPSRPPLFVFFPTISTHFPFSPTPPYQPDWRRMLTDDHPYDGPAIVRAYAHQPNWTDFSPGYVEAMAYDLALIGGYLRVHADRDLVLIVLGDHQPPAAVSGEGAPWDVPVHVIARRTVVLDQLLTRGFRNGLAPQRPALGAMHSLLPILLDAFGERP